VSDAGPRLEIGNPSGPAWPLESGNNSGGAVAEVVDFDRLPSGAEASWLHERFHLVSADPRRTGYRIEAGVAVAPEAEAPSEASQSGPAGPLNSGFPAVKTDPLRPDTFSEVVGQKAAVDSLRLAVEASQASGEMPDHVLLSGRPGLGKSTLAAAFARELGGRLKIIDAATLDDSLTLIGHLVSARDRDVIFLDEIHALPVRQAEVLYGALEDGAINMSFFDGARTKTLRVSLAKVTFIGATTNPGRVPEPLVMRFPMCEELEPYGKEELAEIVRRAAGRNGLAVDSEAADVLARASLGCARTAINLYRCLRRTLRARGASCATADLAREALAAARVDERGLGSVHRRILEILAENRGPMAVKRLARAAGLTFESFRTLYEPVLFEIGAMSSTPRGMALRRS
jgi:holliday junction DNA helicase RuvB